MITKIHFIVNPIAGNGKNMLSMKHINKIFPPHSYEIEIKSTGYPKHAIELTKESIAGKADIIVACGGDGTVNEVASCLLNTNIALGIIPMGSGNGLASNLKIPRRLSQALNIIKNRQLMAIDTGQINSFSFFSNMGIGFDAHVISDFEKNTKRKLWGYIKSIIKTLKNYRIEHTFEIEYPNVKRTISPFLLFVSNSNEMGYNMSLTPKASLHDGLLDIIIVPKLSLIRMIFFIFLFFLKKHHWMREIEFIQIDSLLLRTGSKKSFMIQKDGESFELYGDSIKINLLPEALKVCVG